MSKQDKKRANIYKQTYLRVLLSGDITVLKAKIVRSRLTCKAARKGIRQAIKLFKLQTQ